MSNFYIDTEFLEGTQTKRILGIPFGQTNPTIDFISIGIVSEDSREYYAISKDFNLKEAWNRYDEKPNMDYKPSLGGGSDGYYNPMFIKEYWIRENVLKPIYYDLIKFEFGENSEHIVGELSYKTFKELLQKHGKTNKQIAEEVKEFVYEMSFKDNLGNAIIHENNWLNGKPQFYGYYSAYDHVALCWLFGKMIDLPKGFPMYTRDLKQELDAIEEQSSCEVLKNHPNYPQQTNEHSAIHDARWNKQLHQFLKSL